MWTSNGIADANGNEGQRERENSSESGSENGNGDENVGESGMTAGRVQQAGAEGSAAAGIQRARWQ